MSLSEAQAAFRHSPGRATALAYMDAPCADAFLQAICFGEEKYA